MLRNGALFVCLLSVAAVSGYFHVNVQMIDENTCEEHIVAYVDDDVIHDVSNETFNMPDGLKKYQRNKRGMDVRMDKVAEDGARKTDCIEEDKKLADKAGRSPQLAKVIDLYGTAVLPCHFCGTTLESARMAPKLWMKFERETLLDTGDLLWRPKEVQLDMFSNEKLNRVMERDTMLIIKDFQDSDTGSYFCMTFNGHLPDESLAFKSPETEQTSAAAMVDMWGLMEHDTKVNVVYHLDIEVSKSPKIVSEAGYPHPFPYKDVENAENNWLVTTTWNEWGACNACGIKGEKRRTGHCIIKRLKGNERSLPKYMHNVLKLYPEGAPCHSSLFEGYDVTERFLLPLQILIGECFEPCPTRPGMLFQSPEDSFFHDVFRIDSETDIDIMGLDLHDLPVKTKTIKKLIGQPVKLKCKRPDKFKVTDSIRWTNNSALLLDVELARLFDQRVTITSDFDLNFRNVTSYDDATYICYHGNKRLIKYHLSVSSPVVLEDPREYLVYLVMVYTGNFVLFVIALTVEHQYRGRWKSKCSPHQLMMLRYRLQMKSMRQQQS